MSKKTVCVTGGTGYLASKLIEGLLRKGYRVRATVRSLNNSIKIAPLQKLTSIGDLSLFEADLLSEGSFREAMDGCECVFHTASPMVTSYSLADPKKQLVDPAIEGTRNIIGEAIKSNSVSTVVLTSSISAITSHAKPEDYVFSEKDWNDDASIDDSPYSFGKTLAEKEAWKLVSGTKIRLVAINPSFIIGSSIGIHPESKSIAHPIEILDGSYYEKGAPSIEECTVDIRDVVEAHIRAFENPTASGRYLVSSEHSTTPLDWAKILASEPQFASYPLPTKLTKGKLKKTHLSSEKVQKELGIHFIPLEESLKEVAQFLIESGVVRTLKRQHHCCT